MYPKGNGVRLTFSTPASAHVRRPGRVHLGLPRIPSAMLTPSLIARTHDDEVDGNRTGAALLVSGCAKVEGRKFAGH